MRGVEVAIPEALAWVHPGTTLQRSAHQQLHHLTTVSGPLQIFINIGTNNVAQGDSPYDILRGMRELMDKVRERYRYEVSFAVCSILPRPVDDATTKHIVRETNLLLEHLSFENEGVIYLRTNRFKQ